MSTVQWIKWLCRAAFTVIRIVLFLALLMALSQLDNNTQFMGVILLVVALVILFPNAVRDFAYIRRDSSLLLSKLGQHQGTEGWWIEKQRREQAEALKQDITRSAPIVERALARAENPLTTAQFRLEDIGLLLYNNSPTPTISREEMACASNAHLRPYVILSHSESASDDNSAVSFGIWDNDHDQLLYDAHVSQLLSNKAMLLTPHTSVQIPNNQPTGEWSLRVSIKGYGLLAVHKFKWWRGDQELHFTSDGEIDPRIVELLMARLTEPVEDEAITLDELLAQQKSDP